MRPKTIIITGGTSGIGREAALLLAAQEHTVFAVSRKVPQEPMPGVTYLPLDVRSAESILACVDTVLAQTGQIDVLVNNAGYAGPAGASEEASLDDVRALFETNFFGLVQMVNAVLPAMRQRRRGLILNISSVAGRMSMPPFFGFYSASKHALEGYSEALSLDYMLFVRTILPERVFQAYLRWFLLGGQSLKISDDDNTLRRKMGFRRFMLENPLADRLLTGTTLALIALALIGLVAVVTRITP